MQMMQYLSAFQKQKVIPLCQSARIPYNIGLQNTDKKRKL